NGTVAVRFEIADGPLLPVRQVRFVGDLGFSEKQLRAQMQNIAPWKSFVSLHSKNAYSRDAFEEDRRRILNYYLDHGYLEARLGSAEVTKSAERFWKPFFFPHRAACSGLLLTVPVQAGFFYGFESIESSEDLQRAVEQQSGKSVPL